MVFAKSWEQPGQTTWLVALEKTVVIVRQPEHLTSMKYEFGDWTTRLSLLIRDCWDFGGYARSKSD